MSVNYSLISAVREGRLERVRELIDTYGLSYSSNWGYGHDLLCDALNNGHVAVAKLLLARGSSATSRCRHCIETPLHLAVTAFRCDAELVEMILQKGGSVRAQNKRRDTALQVVIKEKRKQNEDQLRIVELLVDYGSDVNCRYSAYWKEEYTPLHFAVEGGKDEVVALLLRRGAYVDAKAEDSITPLHIAAEKGHARIAENLFNHGACIHSTTAKEGYTPLHFASRYNANDATVKLLLNRGADINAVSTKSKETPLLLAAKTGHAAVVNLLLENGAKVDDQDMDGETVLQIVVRRESDMTMVEDVLKYCPDIDNPINRNSLKTAVHGSQRKSKRIVEALLKYGFTLHPEDGKDSSLLHAAVEKGYLNIVEDLLKYGANVNTLGATFLHTAAKNKQEEVAKLLISYEADPNAQDKYGKTPILHAIENDDLNTTELLLTSGANVKDSPELLNTAVQKQYLEIVEALLEHGADINATDQNGKTPILYAIENADLNTIELLLTSGANVRDSPKLLNTAVEKQYLKIVEALLEHGADINASDKDGKTALHYTACREIDLVYNKDPDISYHCSCSYYSTDDENPDNNDQWSCSCWIPRVKIAKLLLSKGANVNAKQVKDGSTALHIAAQKDDREIAKALLQSGAEVDSRDKKGRTALHIASLEGHNKLVKTLLEYGADINVTCATHATPLDYARAGSEYHYYRYRPNDDDYDDEDDHDRNGCYSRTVCSWDIIAKTLRAHIVKMQIAGLYVSKQNLNADIDIDIEYERYYRVQCKDEIAIMKTEKINNSPVSFYEILKNSTKYVKNANIAQALEADSWKEDFPIYASMIESNFRKGIEREELLEQGNQIFHCLFNNSPDLPYECTEKILSYLSGEQLKFFIHASKFDRQ